MTDMWEMHTCGDCGSLYMDPRPDNESLPRVYEDYHTHEPTPDSTDVAGPLWRLVHGYLNSQFGTHRVPSSSLGALVFRLAIPWRQKLDHYCRDLRLEIFPERGALLDFGCGNGTFLERAREMGWQAVGCEPDGLAVEVGRRAGLEIVHGDIFSTELDGREFDAITASHVIEHVPDVKAALTRAFELTRQGGSVWFAFPNPDCFTLKLYGTASVALHIPYHLCIPSQQSFAAVLEEVGFTGVRLLRRGMQSPSNWIESERIAEEQGLPRPSRLTATLSRLLSSLLSSVSARWGEETVFIARKP